MSSLTQNQAQVLKRSLSYNDLKKRRMVRSMTNKGKLHAIHLQPLQKNEIKNEENCIKTSKSILQNLQKGKTEQIRQNLSDQNNKENQNGKFLNRLHLTGEVSATNVNSRLELKNQKQQPSSNFFALLKNNPSQANILNQKKTKSTRIMTKKLSINNGQSKISEELLRRINGVQEKSENKNVHTQSINEYKSAPENKLERLKTSEQNFLMINSLSPITKNNISARRQEVSGFSLLHDIGEGLEEISGTGKGKLEPFQISEFRGVPHLSEFQGKMPKLMKKYLPKDFFLRG